MNTLRIGVIAIWVVVGASGYLARHGAAPDDVRPVQETRAQKARLVTSDQEVSRDAVHAPETFEPDAAEQKQPSHTLDEVLGAVNAGIGPEGEYVDREALAAVLSSDPELARLLDESEF
jgi:hypothetical protein